MVRCLSNLMQKPVLGYYSGKRLGAVYGFTLHPDTHRLLRISVKRHRWSAGRMYRICDICKDSSRMSLLALCEEGIERDKRAEESGIEYPICLGAAVMTHANIQGQIADIWVDWSSEMVAWYEISKGYLDDMRQGRSYGRGYWVKKNQKDWIFQCVQEV